jgi:hypothetical protein
MGYIATANFAYGGKTYYIGDDAPESEVLLRLNLIEPKGVEVDASESVHEGDED